MEPNSRRGGSFLAPPAASVPPGGRDSHPQVLPPLPHLQLSALPAGPEAPRTNGKRKTKSARGEGPGWWGERGSLCPCVSPAVAQPVPRPPAALSAGPAASPRPGARTAAAPAAPTAPRSPPTTAAPNPPAGRDSPGSPPQTTRRQPPASAMGPCGVECRNRDVLVMDILCGGGQGAGRQRCPWDGYPGDGGQGAGRQRCSRDGDFWGWRAEAGDRDIPKTGIEGSGMMLQHLWRVCEHGPQTGVSILS